VISLLCELVAHQQHYDFARQKITALLWESIPRQTCRARPLWGRATIFWSTKNNCPFMGIDPTTNMSGPPPMGAGYNFCRSCSIELQNLLSRETDGFCCTYSYSRFNRGGPGFSCAHPSIKIFHRIKSFFFTVCENGR